MHSSVPTENEEKNFRCFELAANSGKFCLHCKYRKTRNDWLWGCSWTRRINTTHPLCFLRNPNKDVWFKEMQNSRNRPLKLRSSSLRRLSQNMRNYWHFCSFLMGVHMTPIKSHEVALYWALTTDLLRRVLWVRRSWAPESCRPHRGSGTLCLLSVSTGSTSPFFWKVHQNTKFQF